MSLYRDKPLKGKRAVVIGAGMAGLSSAISLASAGARVRVLEKSDRFGGRLQQLRLGEFSFNMGPEFVTSSHVLGRLFSQADHRISDFVQFRSLDPMVRLVFDEERHLDVYRDIEKLCDQVMNFSERDADFLRKKWPRFESLALDAEELFFAVPSVAKWNWKSLLTSAAGIRVAGSAFSFTRLASYLRRKFDGPGLPEVYAYFVSRLGTSPHACGKMIRSLATLELSRGAQIPEGGMEALLDAMVRLAKEKGVRFSMNAEVTHIETEHRQVRNITGNGFQPFAADLVVSTVCPSETLENFFETSKPREEEFKRLARKENSPSQLSFFWGLKRKIPELERLQTVLLSDNSKEADRQLRKWKVAPAQPDIFITNESFATPSYAPEGKSALKISMLAPAHSDRFQWNETHINRERELLFQRFDALGWNLTPEDIEEETVLTPADWQRLLGVQDGALFGTSYTGLKGWAYRSANFSQSVRGLYFAGAWTHPGPTLPLVLTSGMLASRLAAQHYSTGQ